MHELAVMESIVAAVEDTVRQRRVTRLWLRVGALCGVVPEALRFCFELSVRGTVLEGAALEIDEVGGRARCLRCASELKIDSYLDLCSCGNGELDILAGQELTIKAVEVQ